MSTCQLLTLVLKAMVPGKSFSTPTPGTMPCFYVITSHGELSIMENP